MAKPNDQSEGIEDMLSNVPQGEDEPAPQGDGEEPTPQPTGDQGDPDTGEEPAEPTEPTMAEMREKIERLEGQIASQQEPTPDPEPEPEPEPLTVDPVEFVDEETFAAIQEDRGKLNEVLNNLFVKALNTSREQFLKETPNIVESTVGRQQQLATTAKQFYEQNSDLKPHAQYVGYVANNVRAEMPNKPLKDVLAETAKRVRNTLNIQQEAESVNNNTKPNNNNSQPAFASTRNSSGSRQNGADDRSDAQKQIDNMLDSLGGTKA